MAKVFEIEKKKILLEELKDKSNDNSLWDDQEYAAKILKELSDLENEINEYYDLKMDILDLGKLMEIASSDDEEEVSFLKKELSKFKDILSVYRLKTMLSGEYDSLDAILEIHSGAGGLEAQDWAEMLLRMYKRYADDHGFKVNVVDLLNDTEGGIKSVTMIVEGKNAYGYLKGEKGVHRMVRLSPFDTAGKRHTSFASVDVMPKLDDSIDITINENDLQIDTYRSSGAGGQSVNTTDSAVRIKHIPTGVVVSCQNERSQLKNKEMAMKLLKGKLIALKEQERKEKIDDLKGNYSKIEWGSQIRSYVFHPYKMVKDHRTNYQEGDVRKVMDGDIDGFINSYLLSGGGK